MEESSPPSDPISPPLSSSEQVHANYDSIARDPPASEIPRQSGYSCGRINGSRPSRDSLPKLQLLIICLMRLCEPIAFTVVFPMVAFMIADFNKSLTEKQIGFYSGAVESVFAFSQLMTIMPVILCGLSGAIISTIIFGFSHSFSQMLIARGLGGILNVAMMGEMTTPENQALGFSFLPLSYAMGSTVGPLLGGYLSQPAERFPNTWFGRTQFWHDFPWVLPCFVASIIPLVSCVLGYVYLEETLPTKTFRPHIKPRHALNCDSTTPLLQDSPTVVAGEPASPSISILLRDRNLRTILVNYSLLSFQTIALEALLVLFAYTPVESGGIGFSAANIGIALSISGVFTMIVQLALFSSLQKRFGTVKLYQICMSAYPVIFLLFPLIHLTALAEQSQNEVRSFGVWIGLGILLALKTTANIVFSCNMILVNSVAPTRNSLGTINGIAQCCASFVRAIGPITASSMFALSVLHNNILNGNTVFYLFACIALLAYLSSLIIQEGDELWRTQ
ncbi:major facilitator superfamily domain-containing protein [Melampsora americana]|nr:major facilitator superfamily domain-containing protein [Melampsora americana]